MKLKATFEKHNLEVGLSAVRPIISPDPEAKYAVADLIGSVNLKYQKMSGSFELDITSDELAIFPELNRLRCYVLVNQLPAEAVHEAEEELQGIRDHYVQVAQTRASLPPPKRSPEVRARIARRSLP
ncbi:MAG TPA: hypothetical protein VGS03_16005 [Candidatus Polarisedimenticolia bacterium]|jgi:hypothetical protein|nr:hypothetical protein [Candidatus Polarisedimenticolia bacterium]